MRPPPGRAMKMHAALGLWLLGLVPIVVEVVPKEVAMDLCMVTGAPGLARCIAGQPDELYVEVVDVEGHAHAHAVVTASTENEELLEEPSPSCFLVQLPTLTATCTIQLLRAGGGPGGG